ncbi:hypothetical protein LINPERHAP2_LOCUS15006 [Linum perenne]
MMVTQELNPRCPRIAFTDDEVKSFCQPWSKALVVKVLERSFSFLAMKRRLEFLWARSGAIQVSDLDNSLFLVRFAQEKDYKATAFGGPWKIFDYYIAVAQWSPSFSEEDPFKTILTWVRLPKLPIQYFNQVAVQRIGNCIGKTVRMDLATSEGARGRYARVCVEVDISKPLLGKYMIEDKVLKIEYESLENMCFDCGMYGHKSESCPSKVMPQINDQVSHETILTKGVVEEHDTGEWMTVQRRNRLRATKAENQNRKSETIKVQAAVQQEKGKSDSSQSQKAKEVATPSSAPKASASNGYAEALRKVLAEASISPSKTVGTHQKAPVQSQRLALSEITNLADPQGMQKVPSQVVIPESLNLNPVDPISKMVEVPVLTKIPRFRLMCQNPEVRGL